jgi:hypothetical protein
LLTEARVRPERIAPIGEATHPTQPLENENLVAEFAGIRSATDLLGFIKEYGPLTNAGHNPLTGEDVPDMLNVAAFFRDFLGYTDKKKTLATRLGEDGAVLVRRGGMDIVMGRDPATGDPELRLRPKWLLAGLYLKLGQIVSAARPFRECRLCGKPFEVGPTSGRRRDAGFCSDEHRASFHNARRPKRQSAHAEAGE